MLYVYIFCIIGIIIRLRIISELKYFFSMIKLSKLERFDK